MGTIRVELAKWLFDIARKREDVDLYFRSLQPVDINRNEIVRYFLNETKHEWLLMIDSDQLPKTDLTQMAKHGKKVIGGLTTVLHKGIPMPLVMKRATGIKHIMWRRLDIEDLEDRQFKKTGLFEVDGLGTGVIMIHRSVLEKMPKPWFKFSMYKDGSLRLSEDYYFSHKLKKMGIKMYVDSDARAGHAKNIDLFEMNKLISRIAQHKGIKVEKLDKVKNEEYIIKSG